MSPTGSNLDSHNDINAIYNVVAQQLELALMGGKSGEYGPIRVALIEKLLGVRDEDAAKSQLATQKLTKMTGDLRNLGRPVQLEAKSYVVLGKIERAERLLLVGQAVLFRAHDGQFCVGHLVACGESMCAVATRNSPLNVATFKFDSVFSVTDKADMTKALWGLPADYGAAGDGLAGSAAVYNFLIVRQAAVGETRNPHFDLTSKLLRYKRDLEAKLSVNVSRLEKDLADGEAAGAPADMLAGGKATLAKAVEAQERRKAGRALLDATLAVLRLDGDVDALTLPMLLSVEVEGFEEEIDKAERAGVHKIDATLGKAHELLERIKKKQRTRDEKVRVTPQ